MTQFKRDNSWHSAWNFFQHRLLMMMMMMMMMMIVRLCSLLCLFVFNPCFCCLCGKESWLSTDWHLKAQLHGTNVQHVCGSRPTGRWIQPPVKVGTWCTVISWPSERPWRTAQTDLQITQMAGSGHDIWPWPFIGLQGGLDDSMLCSTYCILVSDCFFFFGLREAGKIWWKMAKVEPMKQIVAVSKQTHVPPYCNPKNIRGLKDPTKPVPLGAEIHGVEVGRIMSFHAMWTPDSNKLWAVKVNIIDLYIYIYTTLFGGPSIHHPGFMNPWSFCTLQSSARRLCRQMGSSSVPRMACAA